jgi:hypothetical protein
MFLRKVLQSRCRRWKQDGKLVYKDPGVLLLRAALKLQSRINMGPAMPGRAQAKALFAACSPIIAPRKLFGYMTKVTAPAGIQHWVILPTGRGQLSRFSTNLHGRDGQICAERRSMLHRKARSAESAGVL